MTAHDRLREATHGEHPCVLHYLGVAVDDVGHGQKSSLRYTYALELERSGARERALGT